MAVLDTAISLNASAVATGRRHMTTSALDGRVKPGHEVLGADPANPSPKKGGTAAAASAGRCRSTVRL